MKNILFWTIFTILMVWFAASYIDVIAHNTTTCTYQPWNLIQLVWIKG